MAKKHCEVCGYGMCAGRTTCSHCKRMAARRTNKRQQKGGVTLWK